MLRLDTELQVAITKVIFYVDYLGYATGIAISVRHTHPFQDATRAYFDKRCGCAH